MQLSLALIEEITLSNPWLKNQLVEVPGLVHYYQRIQEKFLMDQEWDAYWTVLMGPRRAGKTTLGFHLSQKLIHEKKFDQLLYFNCDLQTVRTALISPSIILDLIQYFKLKNPIIFIDEAQRIENPGLLLKALIDLRLPIKCIVSGSSQLEMKSKISESLAGRAIESLVLPPSWFEFQNLMSLNEKLIFGCYFSIIKSQHKEFVLGELYKQYIEKDIVEILKIDKPHVIEKLITLIAHSSGQLVNYQTLANDCQISIPTVQSYLDKFEKTFVIAKITPFVGNKRTEITQNPKYYFIDNGFRHYALRNFTALDYRADLGALVENFVFQELLKFKTQHFLDLTLYFWRTKAKAEVDFIVYKNEDCFLPVEVKYANFKRPAITKSFRSFLQAYQPKRGVIITRDLLAQETFENTLVHFIPLELLEKLFIEINMVMSV